MDSFRGGGGGTELGVVAGVVPEDELLPRRDSAGGTLLARGSSVVTMFCLRGFLRAGAATSKPGLLEVDDMEPRDWSDLSEFSSFVADEVELGADIVVLLWLVKTAHNAH